MEKLKIAFKHTDKIQLKCTGQTSATQCLSNLIPSCSKNSSHISVKPTLQVADPGSTNVYTVGEVAELLLNRNPRAAMEQAAVAVGNVVNTTN